MSSTELPSLVKDAAKRADRLEFEISCEPFVGRLLSVLAANVRIGGRILELGTGAGVGIAWIVSGLGTRDDVEVVTVETDGELLEDVRKGAWPSHVTFVEGDGAEQVHELGEFDLIFADAPGGKLTNLEGTISALAENGMLVVDDMDLAGHDDDLDLREAIAALTAELMADQRLVCVELPISSGVILAVRRG